MCGIISLYSKRAPVNEANIQAALKSLYHRGPDQQNYWLSESKKIALGHTRLSIIDLTTGDQPISNSSNSHHIVANGEFYDFEIIRKQLQEKGYHFKTGSDSEIALHLYNEYGTACLKHLRGEFAFCIWDESQKVFFAARDRFGIKPLYYAWHNDQLYIASEIKALIAAGVPAKWDVESYLSRAFFFRDRSLFEGIHQVPPGHYILATDSGFRINKYWDISYPTTDEYHAEYNEDEIIKDVRNSLLDATRTRLRADVPVGVYLSGGLDSCAVLGMATEIHHKSVDAFTLSFESPDYDESAIAKKMAEHSGANYNPISIKQSDLADYFSESIKHSETVCMNAHGIAKYVLSKEVRKQGYRVVLTGEGADEVFAGYSSFRNDMILYNSESQNPDTVQSLLDSLNQSNKVSSGLLTTQNTPKNIEFIKRFLSFEPSWLPPLAEINNSIKDLYNADTKSYLGNINPIYQFLIHSDLVNQVEGREPVHASMYLMSKSALPNYVLTILGDRMEMANSLEGRLPFLDHHLVEKVRNLPVRYKIRGMQEKYIMREAVKPYVIKDVYQREKHPFLAPPSVLSPSDKLHQLVQDTLRSDLFNSLPFFNQDAVISFLDEIPNLAQDKWASTEAILMELLSLSYLQHHYKLSS